MELFELGELDTSTLDRALERVDRDLVALIRYRIELARRGAATRVAHGETGYSHARDLAAVGRYAQLGPAGYEFASLLIRLTRRASSS